MDDESRVQTSPTTPSRLVKHKVTFIMRGKQDWVWECTCGAGTKPDEERGVVARSSRLCGYAKERAANHLQSSRQ